MTGRPTKRTPEIIKKIEEVLRAGNTRKTAYIVAGIDKSTFCAWLAKADFSDAVTRAEEEAIATAAAIVKRAAIGVKATKTVTKRVNGNITESVTTETVEYDWRAAAFLLERRRPDEWGEKKKIDIADISSERLMELLEQDEAESSGQTAASS